MRGASADFLRAEAGDLLILSRDAPYTIRKRLRDSVLMVREINHERGTVNLQEPGQKPQTTRTVTVLLNEDCFSGLVPSIRRTRRARQALHTKSQSFRKPL